MTRSEPWTEPVGVLLKAHRLVVSNSGKAKKNGAYPMDKLQNIREVDLIGRSKENQALVDLTDVFHIMTLECTGAVTRFLPFNGLHTINGGDMRLIKIQ